MTKGPFTLASTFVCAFAFGMLRQTQRMGMEPILCVWRKLQTKMEKKRIVWMDLNTATVDTYRVRNTFLQYFVVLAGERDERADRLPWIYPWRRTTRQEVWRGEYTVSRPSLWRDSTGVEWCKELHWLQLTASSVTTSTRLQRAVFSWKWALLIRDNQYRLQLTHVYELNYSFKRNKIKYHRPYQR